MRLFLCVLFFMSSGFLLPPHPGSAPQNCRTQHHHRNQKNRLALPCFHAKGDSLRVALQQQIAAVDLRLSLLPSGGRLDPKRKTAPLLLQAVVDGIRDLTHHRILNRNGRCHARMGPALRIGPARLLCGMGNFCLSAKTAVHQDVGQLSPR